MSTGTGRTGWISRFLKKSSWMNEDGVLRLSKRDRSIQKSVDLLEAMEKESSSGDHSSPPTLKKERWRRPFVLSFTRAQEIQRQTTPYLPQPDSSSSSKGHGTLSPSQSPEEPIAPDRSTNQNRIYGLQRGSKTDMGGGSGPPTTQDSAEDSETGCRYCTEKDPVCAFPSDPLAHGMFA